MTLAAKITFYSITHCGYYKFKKKNAPIFGGIEETLFDLKEWVKNLPFEATKTFEVDDGKTLPVYLLGLVQGNNSWILATWNQVPASEVGVSSVSKTSMFDEIKVFANSIEENSIPGFPTYFWILPELNYFATVCFDVYNGKDGFQNYIDNFLAFNPNHCFEMTTEFEGKSLTVYKESVDSDHGKGKIFPSFRSVLCRKPGKINFLLKNFGKINKVIRKPSVNISNTVELDQWQKALKIFKFTLPNQIIKKNQDSQDFHIRTEINAKFDTAEPLKEIIQEWQNNPSKTSWDDYGFLLKNEQSPIWLSQSIARDKFELPLEPNIYGLVDLENLLSELEKRQEHILKICDEN